MFFVLQVHIIMDPDELPPMYLCMEDLVLLYTYYRRVQRVRLPRLFETVVQPSAF